MNPIARREQLTVREVLEDTLVYDERTGKVHSLNSTVVLVWQNCDGQNSPQALSRIVARELQINQPEAEALVDLALEQLSKRGLLRAEKSSTSEELRLARRRMLKQLVCAAVAIPVILTIKAPPVSAAISR